MNRFCQLLEKYDRLVIFDTETTGLQWSRDEIIEFAAVTVEAGSSGPVVSGEYDQLVALSPGGFVPEAITKLTGLTAQDLRERGPVQRAGLPGYFGDYFRKFPVNRL